MEMSYQEFNKKKSALCGFCKECGEWQKGDFNPDADGEKCEFCGENEVCGMESGALSGLFEIYGETPDRYTKLKTLYIATKTENMETRRAKVCFSTEEAEGECLMWAKGHSDVFGSCIDMCDVDLIIAQADMSLSFSLIEVGVGQKELYTKASQ